MAASARVSASLSCRSRSFPCAFRGSFATKTICFGTLDAAQAAPGRTRAAPSRSPSPRRAERLRRRPRSATRGPPCPSRRRPPPPGAPQHLLHLLRGDVLAAADDHLVAAARARRGARRRRCGRGRRSAASRRRRARRGRTFGPRTRIEPSSMRTSAGRIGVPAEPGLALAWPGGRVVTCDAASVSP